MNYVEILSKKFCIFSQCVLMVTLSVFENDVSLVFPDPVTGLYVLDVSIKDVSQGYMRQITVGRVLLCFGGSSPN